MRPLLPLALAGWTLLTAATCAVRTPRDEPSAGTARQEAPPPALERSVPGEVEPDSERAAPEPGEGRITAELSTVGWDALSGSPVVLLRDVASSRVLPIWIGAAEARAIGLALYGLAPPRPMTHDLMANLLGELHATLEEVVVSDLRGGTYYGLLKLRIDGEDTPRWVDTRPSDGLALALRTGARISVTERLFEEQPDIEFLAPEGPEQVVRALGLTVAVPDAELRRELELPEREGLAVLTATGEARTKGLERGDLIVALDGETPREPIDLLAAIDRATVRGVLAVTYLRGGEETTVELEIRVGPAAPRRDEIVA